MHEQYQPREIEAAAQSHWDAQKSFVVSEQPGKDTFYCLSMFPYPSGKLHMGHVRNYTIGDVIARYQRMQGKNVLQPMGWDAFGMPAENAAMKNKVAPAKWTYENIDYMKTQLKSLGLAIDWSREVTTCKPDYYRWEQWLFTRLFQKGVIYRKNGTVNWDPVDQTVLANEQVIDGRGWRSGAPIEKREIPMYYFKITAYADELLNSLDDLDGWPEQVKTMQRNWIGKSRGMEVSFPFDAASIGESGALKVFTTRPDTLMGATYVAVAAEHHLASLAARNNAELQAFIEECKRGGVAEADIATQEKKGLPTGLFVLHPLTGEKLPVWVANYVLIHYGDGAVMAVPAHDERDFEFAKKFGLRIIQVVEPPDPQDAERARREELCFTGNGTAINSGPFNGLPTSEFKEKITAWLAQRGQGKKAINYKLRDWLFSRQRYWGEPFPILHTEDGRVIALSEDDLPLVLPEVEDYRPPGTGESPLAKVTDWVNVTLPDGTRAKRETNTMPQWAGSCWYYLRYLDPRNAQRPWDPAKEKCWMPVDLYIGGAEHAVLHLLYSRFWHKFLYDHGYVSTKEPFQKLINQGMILGEDGQKMSKSRGNVVNPDQVVAEYGADSMRLYEMFMGPLEAIKPWSTQGVQGVYRFLQKAWRLIVDDRTDALAEAVQEVQPNEETLRLLHQTIRKVGRDVETFAFNTAISAMMIFVNHLGRLEVRPRSALEPFLLLLAPFAPHITEELWQRLGHDQSLAHEPWPKYDEELAKEKQVELAVQVNGKVRDHIVVPADCEEEQIKEKALHAEKVVAALAGKTPKKVIVIKARLVNIVV